MTLQVADEEGLCLAGASLASLDFALCAFEDDPVRSGMAEAAIPHDDCSV